ncbi:MAG: alanine--tRNA ligase, partial [Endomicrobiia bacterium]
MKSSQIRKEFLDFFKNYDHNVVPSDSLIPKSDPSLLFTSAGMVQFKKFFLGEEKMNPPRAVSCQKCFRTSDLEKIGYTPRHLSFFEMLGNFSFGDYFKKSAIEWAWEFLIKTLSIPEDKLYITVYKEDDEAYNIWKKIVKEERIYKLSEETNFWNMGPTGPCGPCSEIIYDLGKEIGCGKKTCAPGCDCDRWLEVWNLVFTQFDRQQDGKLLPLPQKNIDTGMGLERLCAVVNNKNSVFETDLFLPLIKEIEEILEKNYTSKKSSSIKIISDHVRGLTFLIGDGILPSNEGRGYILRRIIRRAVRQAKLLGINKPFLYKLSAKVVEVMKDVYPELSLRRENIATITKMEEEKFLETLDSGMEILNSLISDAKKAGKKILSGKEVFNLYDTYGFPPELTEEILKENSLSFNQEEFLEVQKQAKSVAKASWKGIKVQDTSIYKKFPPTEFVGYEKSSCESEILGIIGEGQQVEIVLNKTPFYAESGGQVGDKGTIKILDSNLEIISIAEILDTQKIENVFIHKAKITKGSFSIGNRVIAEIDIKRRKKIMRHHTATHLLHKALRTVLGEHATQSGSLVSDDRFRFDFTHFKALTPQEILRIEEIVQEKIMECIPVNIVITTLAQAKKLNAMALFGEKYTEEVRCVYIGDSPESAYSIELCGGTHCKNTGEIGPFKILGDSSVGSGLRRIEAVCGTVAIEFINKIENILDKISEKLKSSPEEILNKVTSLLEKQKQLEREIENLRINPQISKSEDFSYILKTGENLIVKKFSDKNISEKNLRSIVDEQKNKLKTNAIIIVLNATSEKISFVISATKDLIDKGFDVLNIAKKFAKIIEGSA